jgi:hypothetical protein
MSARQQQDNDAGVRRFALFLGLGMVFTCCVSLSAMRESWSLQSLEFALSMMGVLFSVPMGLLLFFLATDEPRQRQKSSSSDVASADGH